MAPQKQPALSTPSPRRAKKARLGNLNMGIAKTHRVATQLVGIQLSGANLLALTVSAASIVAGTMTLAAQKYPYNWPLLIAAGVIGLGLALLIEGLTLGSLIRIRVANRSLRQIEEKVDSEMSAVLANLKIPDLNQPDSRRTMRQYRQTVRLVQQNYQRKYRRATSLQRKQRRFSLPFAAMGATSSAAAGGLFYHTILAGLGQAESIILAILFPLIVTGTFVASEIYKDAQEDAIKEGFGGGALTETAIREETKLQSALAVQQKVVAYLKKPEAEQAIEAGAKSLLHDILIELRETSRQLTPRSTITEEPDDATREPLLSLLPEQTRHNLTASDARHDNLDNRTPHHPFALQPEPAQNANGVDERQPVSQRNSAQHDTAAFPFAQQDVQDNRQRHDNGAEDSLVQYHTTPVQRRQKRKSEPPHGQKTLRSFQEATPVPTAGTTTGHDSTTARILAYLAEHDHAKQAEVAAALGVTVRTVQRKLATLRMQGATKR